VPQLTHLPLTGLQDLPHSGWDGCQDAAEVFAACQPTLAGQCPALPHPTHFLAGRALCLWISKKSSWFALICSFFGRLCRRGGVGSFRKKRQDKFPGSFSNFWASENVELEKQRPPRSKCWMYVSSLRTCLYSEGNTALFLIDVHGQDYGRDTAMASFRYDTIRSLVRALYLCRWC
jgi:hypothetical protein